MTTRRATAMDGPVAATAPGPAHAPTAPGAAPLTPSRRARIEGLLLGLAS
ncbi:ADP-ribosylglycohydrolase family protein, partial [Streptomyces fulvissimus]|nr:ADP-ribosylglycohydrolase family protein [Streptomyces microflavus]